jgi:methylamine utilization protein MauE
MADAARVVLVVTFTVSAIAKARSWRTLPDAMRAFGFAPPFDRVVAYALPAVELFVAVALVVSWSSVWPVWVAVGLLALFTVFVVRAAVRHTPCPCFGASSTTPAGALTVLRNGVLLAIAVLATAPH